VEERIGGFARKVVWVNLVLVAAALVLPRVFAEPGGGFAAATAAAMMYILPMLAALGLAVTAAVRTYIEGRRTHQRIPLVTLMPLVIFCLGLAAAAIIALTRGSVSQGPIVEPDVKGSPFR
jgi:hypothetical protein